MDIAYDEKQRKAHDEAACHPGNAARYGVSVLAPDRTSPLRGKSIAFLGSSVTVGCFSMGQTCADFLARKDGVLASRRP